MAVKKSTAKTAKTESPEVEVTVTTEPEVTVSETKETKAKADTPLVEVDTEVVNSSKAPKEKSCRVKIRKDIKFNFGKEHFDLKAGQTLNVTEAVKRHLNKVDALLPL